MARYFLGISGSPREDGNTDVAVKEALKEIASCGAETRFLRIYDQSIRSCRGCRDCMKIGRCVIEDDDVESILAAMKGSAGVVLGAPIYWDGPPGRMKDFIDRSHGHYASAPGDFLSGLDFSLISVATASGFESHEDIMLSWIEYYGAHLVEKERILAREMGDLVRRPDELRKAKRAGRRLLARALGRA